MGSVIVVVLCLGLKWLQNETWYLIDEKIPLSLWTRKANLKWISPGKEIRILRIF